jgi:hypothetical protein
MLVSSGFFAYKTYPPGQCGSDLWELGNRPDFAMVGPGFLASKLIRNKRFRRVYV